MLNYLATLDAVKEFSQLDLYIVGFFCLMIGIIGGWAIGRSK